MRAAQGMLAFGPQVQPTHAAGRRGKKCGSRCAPARLRRRGPVSPRRPREPSRVVGSRGYSAAYGDAFRHPKARLVLIAGTRAAAAPPQAHSPIRPPVAGSVGKRRVPQRTEQRPSATFRDRFIPRERKKKKKKQLNQGTQPLLAWPYPALPSRRLGARASRSGIAQQLPAGAPMR